jgi:hypothetical protein
MSAKFEVKTRVPVTSFVSERILWARISVLNSKNAQRGSYGRIGGKVCC